MPKQFFSGENPCASKQNGGKKEKKEKHSKKMKGGEINPPLDIDTHGYQVPYKAPLSDANSSKYTLTGDPNAVVRGYDEGKFYHSVPQNSSQSNYSMSGGKKDKKNKKIKGGGEINPPLDIDTHGYQVPYKAPLSDANSSKYTLTGDPNTTFSGYDEGKFYHSVPQNSSQPNYSMTGGKKIKQTKKIKGGYNDFTKANPPLERDNHGYQVPYLAPTSSNDFNNYPLLGDPGTKVQGFDEGRYFGQYSSDSTYSMNGGKKNKDKKSKKNMKGGEESWGATVMPKEFFSGENACASKQNGGKKDKKSQNKKIKGGNSDSGSIKPNLDVGSSELTPSQPGNETMPIQNISRSIQGGSKLGRKSKKGGDLIPYVNDPSPSIRNSVDSAVSKLQNFLTDLDNDYIKSVTYLKSLKFGGKKSKSSKKSTKQKGGDGSDFALTLSSRGPWNAPDNYWGVDGETWFRQFNKTADYIPNSKLPYAAAPLLTTKTSTNNIVTGYDDMGNDYGVVDFKLGNTNT
jgi:hypothetical protein